MNTVETLKASFTVCKIRRESETLLKVSFSHLLCKDLQDIEWITPGCSITFHHGVFSLFVSFSANGFTTKPDLV